MRNYIRMHVAFCGFTESFSNQPCINACLGLDDEDANAIAQYALSYMEQQLPGSTFTGAYISEPPFKFYVELNRKIILRAIAANVGNAILDGFIIRPDYLLAQATTLPDVDYTKFITDVSPRATWSNGH